MNRNLRSELLTAIFVIAGILIAIGAIIALSSSSDTAILNLTPTIISMVESPVDNPTITIADMTAQIVPISVDVTEIVTPEIAVATEPTDDVVITLSKTPTSTDTIILTRTMIRETPTTSLSDTPIPPTRTPRFTNTPRPNATVTLSTHTPTATQTNIVTNTPILPTLRPTRTPRPSSTPIPLSATPTDMLTMPAVLIAEGCLNPSIQITSPRPNDRVSSPFDVIGTATLPNFGLYRIEIRPHDALTYQRIRAVQQVVYADVLAQIDPSDYPTGIYWIRLVVVDNRGAIAENGTCAIPTIFE